MRPAAAAPQAPEEARTTTCAGGPVGFAVYTGVGDAWTKNAELSGSISVSTACGASASGDVGSAFELRSHTESTGRRTYRGLDTTVVIARVPLVATDAIVRQEASAFGDTAPFVSRNLVSLGCATTGDCTYDPGPGGRFAIAVAIEGQARLTAPQYPDSLRCDTSMPLPVLAVRDDGAEGYLGPSVLVKYSLPVESPVRPEARATLEGPDGTDLFITTDYATARAGGILLRAPSCATTRDERPVLINVKTRGGYSGSVRILPPDPVRFEVTLSRDTLDYGIPTSIKVTAVASDGLKVEFPADTLVTFAQAPTGFAWYEARGWGAGEEVSLAYNGPSFSSRTYAHIGITLRGRYRRSDGTYVHIPSPADTTITRPLYDASVSLPVRGGGIAGRGRVVVRGLDGGGPDSVAVRLGAPSVDCGDSTRVSVAGLFGGAPRAIPAGTLVRLVAKDSTVARLAWGDSTGAELRVPIGALRDSSVWVRTQNCDEVEGEVALRVCAEVEAYWDADGVVSGEGTTTLRGGGGYDDPVLRILGATGEEVDHVQVSLWDAWEQYGLHNQDDLFVDHDSENFVVEVTDDSQNLDPDRQESVNAYVRSEGSGVTEDRTAIVLWETDVDTGVFASPAQFLVSRDLPIPPALSDPQATADDNLALPTITSIESAPAYGAVEDDAVGDRSHMAVTGGEVTVDYGALSQRLPVCSPDEVRTVPVHAFAMEEPYFDSGHREGGQVKGRLDGVWNHIDLNGDGFVEKDEPFEEYVEVSWAAGRYVQPRRVTQVSNDIPEGQRRGSVTSQAHHAAMADRTRLSWDQACIRVEVGALTVYDPGPAFFNRTFQNETFDLLLRGRDGNGFEELPIFESLDARIPPGEIAVVYAATLEAGVPNPNAPGGVAERAAVGFAASAELLAPYAARFPEVALDIAALGDRAVMILDPIATVSMRTLAHELGHVLAVQEDPADANEIVKAWYFFPSAAVGLDGFIDSMRRLPPETVRRARRSPYVD